MRARRVKVRNRAFTESENNLSLRQSLRQGSVAVQYEARHSRTRIDLFGGVGVRVRADQLEHCLAEGGQGPRCRHEGTQGDVVGKGVLAVLALLVLAWLGVGLG